MAVSEPSHDAGSGEPGTGRTDGQEQTLSASASMPAPAGFFEHAPPPRAEEGPSLRRTMLMGAAAPLAGPAAPAPPLKRTLRFAPLSEPPGPGPDSSGIQPLPTLRFGSVTPPSGGDAAPRPEQAIPRTSTLRPGAAPPPAGAGARVPIARSNGEPGQAEQAPHASGPAGTLPPPLGARTRVGIPEAPDASAAQAQAASAAQAQAASAAQAQAHAASGDAAGVHPTAPRRAGPSSVEAAPPARGAEPADAAPPAPTSIWGLLRWLRHERAWSRATVRMAPVAGVRRGRTSRKRKLGYALLACAGLAGAYGLVDVAKHQTATSGTPIDEPAPAPARATAVATTPEGPTTRIVSTPSGAELVYRGAVVANTPAAVPRPSYETIYLVRMPGYRPQIVLVSSTSGSEIRVHLRRESDGRPRSASETEPARDVPPESPATTP